MYRETDKPTSQRGHLICIGMISASFILTIILRICLIRENHRRANLSLEKYKCEAAIKEPCDWASSYLIFLIYNVVLSFSLASQRTIQVVNPSLSYLPK